ncbi:reverse transcriptase domain-containing protein [Tanacetum coccineum]
MADDQPMWGNNRAVAPTPGAAIVAVDLGDNFTVKGHHLSMIKDRQFDERSRADPHKHIAEFIEVCGMFRYGNTNADAIKLKLFPSSLAGEAKIWFNELSPGVITTWEEMRQAFVSRFFPPAMFDRLMGEIRDEPTQAIINVGGIFLYKTLNEAHQLLEDRFLLKLDWSKENKTNPLFKTVAFAESEDHSPLLEKMESLTTRIGSQFKEIRGDMKEMRDGCNKCGGPHPSLDCDNKPIGGPKEEEANYASRGYRGNYYGRNSSNWRDRHENRISTPVEENPPIPRLPEKKLDELKFEKTMREFVIAQKARYDFVKNQILLSSKPKFRTRTNRIFKMRIQDLENNVARECLFTRNGKTYDPPANPKLQKLVVSFDDMKMRQREEEVKREVRINVPLVDVLAGMPNYGKFLKDLVSNKSKMEQISAAFLTEECSTILQNKIPPKLGDPKSFLIPCKLANSVEYLSLADLGTSINLMSYSLYTALSGTTLKPTRMSIRLANHTYQYPMGVVKNMLVQVGKFVFPVHFVILQIEEYDRVPLILGRSFLHTADAIIRISETPLDKEFDEFMSRSVQEDEVKDNFKELPPKDELRIRTSIQDPPTDLEMKSLPKHLEYAFLEENSLLLIVISALLEQNEKE